VTSPAGFGHATLAALDQSTGWLGLAVVDVAQNEAKNRP
jgi:hypothetical protein